MSLLDNELYPDMVKDFEKAFAHLKTLKCDISLGTRASDLRLQEKLALLEKGGNAVNPFVDPAECQHYIDFYEARFKKAMEDEKSADR
jgi:hypothetical protein